MSKVSTLVLVRGLPGSGKTTMAQMLSRFDGTGRSSAIFSADDFFTDPFGRYHFDPKKLSEAHAWCQRHVRDALENQTQVVVAHNTFSCRWEMQPYISMAAGHHKLMVVDLFDAGCSDLLLSQRNSHNVPLATIAQMRQRWEHNWAAGNPTPPWER